MNHVVGVTRKTVRFRLRSVIAVKRNRTELINSSPALVAVGR